MSIDATRPDGQGEDGRADGDVVEFPRPDTPTDTDSLVSESSYEVVWDDDPAEADQSPPAPVEGARVPVIPDWLRRGNVGPAARRVAGRCWHRVAFHALRVPWYVVKTLVFAVVGVCRLAGGQVRWWWVSEQYGLRVQAIEAGDADLWLKLHRELRPTRLWRGVVVTAEAIALIVGVVALATMVPPLVRAVVVGVGVVAAARAGRPAGRAIVGTAVIANRFRRLDGDVVLRAYYAAGLGNPDKTHQRITFAPPGLSRDGAGSRVVVDLPYGKTFDDAVKARGPVASGLDVSVNQVFISRDPSSHRRHVLWVADRDPLAIPAGRTPLLRCKPTDIWAAAPFGLDERGNLVSLYLMWISVLIGAQPRKGKTFAARLLALYAALDPWVKLHVVDGKNAPDWRKFTLVADTYIHGTHPDRDGDPVEQLLDLLRRVKKHIQRVNEVLSDIPAAQVPEGKLTRELARDRRYPDLRVWMLVMEEFQVYYELDDKDASAEIASLLSFIKAVGPSAGVIMVSCSQKPSGIGSGDNVKQLFNRYRDNHDVRFALRCGNRNVSEAILGGDAYSEGYDASALPLGKEYLGVGYLYGLTDHTPTVRTYLADHEDAEKILRAARALRERAGTLSGHAAGETIAREVRDVLADVNAVFHPAETGAPWQHLAARLAERIPEHYAEITPDALSAQLRALGVPSDNIKRDGQVLKGAKADTVHAAINRRHTAA